MQEGNQSNSAPWKFDHDAIICVDHCCPLPSRFSALDWEKGDRVTVGYGKGNRGRKSRKEI